MAFLDENGVSHFWAKIKELVSSISTVAGTAIKQIQWNKSADKGTIATTNIIGDHTYTDIPSATQTEAGLLSAADKAKLDGMGEGAEENQNAFSVIQLGDTTTKTAATGKESTLQLYTQANSGLDIAVTGDGMLTFGLGAATASKQGAMSGADKAKLDGFQAASNYALKSDLTAVYKYKGSVAAASNLPTTGQTKGDVYNIEAASSYGPAGTNVAWDGSKWDALGGLLEIEALTNAEIDAICV